MGRNRGFPNARLLSVRADFMMAGNVAAIYLYSGGVGSGNPQAPGIKNGTPKGTDS